MARDQVKVVERIDPVWDRSRRQVRRCRFQSRPQNWFGSDLIKSTTRWRALPQDFRNRKATCRALCQLLQHSE